MWLFFMSIVLNLPHNLERYDILCMQNILFSTCMFNIGELFMYYIL